jgi:hypothetical protein
MKNLDNREHLVRLVRNDAPKSAAGTSNPNKQAFRVFTDNSAFNIEREYDASKKVGQNTYPYVHGVIWEPVADDS